jgi:hypothetical protein
MNNFAIMLSDQGKLSEEVAMQQEVLKKLQRILSDEHLEHCLKDPSSSFLYLSLDL